MLRSQSTSEGNRVLLRDEGLVAACSQVGFASAQTLVGTVIGLKSGSDQRYFASSRHSNRHSQAFAVPARSLSPLITPTYATVSFIAGH